MTALMDWMKLANYFHHEFLEGEITEATYEDLIDALQTFKQFAYDKDEEERKSWLGKE